MAKKKETETATEDASAGTDGKTQVQSVEFGQAAEGGGSGATSSLDILLDMDVPVTVAVGQTELSIQKLLKLGPGTVVKLDKPISEPVDLYIKDARFATGQVVVVEDKFAIKITDILGATPELAQESA